MSPEADPTRNERNQRLLRNRLADEFDIKYKHSKTNNDKDRTLLTVLFDPNEGMRIRQRISGREYFFDYNNLDELIRGRFEPDRDTSLPRLEYKVLTEFAPYREMPGELGRMVGKKLWQVIKIDKLKLSPDRGQMVVQTRVYNPDQKQRELPLLEYWRFESSSIWPGSDIDLGTHNTKLQLPSGLLTT